MTPKQEAFVREYLIDLNATQAAVRAGYSERTARAIAFENLTKPDIANAITAAQQNRAERTKVDADWVLKRLHSEITADLAQMFDARGNLRPIAEWPEVFRLGLVTGVESFEEYDGSGKERVCTGMVRKVKFSDRIRHLELIGKHVDVQAWREQREPNDPGRSLALAVSLSDGQLAIIASSK